MIRLEVEIDDDLIVAYQNLASDLPRVTRRAFRGEVDRIGGKMLAELTETPGPPQYPIRWKTERQRRAFFATDGFGRGIPTERSGALQAGWEIEFTGAGFDIDVAVVNETDYAIFVQGDDAQPFHLDTGWPQAAPIFTRYEEVMMDSLIETWYALTEFKEGRS